MVKEYAEAEIFGQYLLGELPSEEVVKFYNDVLNSNNVKLSPEDISTLSFIGNHPWSVGPIDAALVFLNPYSEVRRRIYLMFAILESTPKYADMFLPTQRSRWYILRLIASAVRAVLDVIIGLFIIKGFIK